MSELAVVALPSSGRDSICRSRPAVRPQRHGRRGALTVLSDDALEAELQAAAMLPAEVVTALEQDRRELTAALAPERQAQP